MLNQYPTRPAARQPRAIVRVNGSSMPGWISWEVTSNTYFAADTFRVSFASSELPGATGPAWFALQSGLFVEILAGFPADPAHPTPPELASLIYGRVDDVEIDPVARQITLTGRDLTSVFIDTRIPGKEWSNTTASRVAFDLALAHGFAPQVTATATRIGTYYKHDQVRLHANQSEWDVLTWLAREEGFVCFVKGQELHFEPDSAEQAEPYVIAWQDAPAAASVQHLSFSRSLTVAKGVTVTVRSASLKTKVAVVESYPSTAKAIRAGQATPIGGDATAYHFTLPAGSTPAQCQAEAQRRYHEVISHEMRLHARLPADNLLTAKSTIRVQGTGTAFDQIYYPMSVTRMMSADEGYTMSIDARNHNPTTLAGVS